MLDMTGTPKIIVSLTSFPEAIKYAVPAIRSVLSGSVLPDKIVLYLTFDQFKDCGIPDEILQLEDSYDIFDVRDYPHDIRSYRKLIPALVDFPDDVIVTVDDDVLYDKNMLKDLLKVHKEHPKAVIANRAKIVDPDKSYKKWKKLRWYDFLSSRIKINPKIIQTGVGGVLYPPYSLCKSMLDEKLFFKIAPTTDDIWFWAATVLNGQTVIPVPFGPHNKPRPVGKPKEISLKSVNFKNGANRNDIALAEIMKRYPELKQFFK